MPIYSAERLEYGITCGHIQIVTELGKSLPAYWAHPNTGRLFPAIALIHDWWGITPIIRRIANFFAQSGYYVIVPDLFDGQVASTPQQAIELLQALGDDGYPRINAALSVLESHHNTNRDVAAVGIGMGGSLAYEAALVRQDMEAAVAFYGFPQRYLGRFSEANAPILGLYGEDDPYILPPVIARLRNELAVNSGGLAHEIATFAGAGHGFFREEATDAEREVGRQALKKTFTFLEQHLRGPQHAPARQVY